MTSKLNLKLFLLAFLLAIMLLVPYELYWRYKAHWAPSHDLESLDLWAYWRGKVNDLGSDDVVILGSSRGHFDINIHLWDSITGRRPIMLAYPGSSPYHPIADIVNNTDFDGLLVISTAPGLFYTIGTSWGAGRGKTFVDYYYKQTYAQKFSQWVYEWIDPWFGYMDPDLNIASLINRLPFEDRDSIDHPPIWPPMVTMDKYRSIRMTPKMETDTAFQNKQTKIWDQPEWKNRYADSVEVIMAHYVGLVKKFKERGGRVAFFRPPITGQYLKHEPLMFPREEYWDRLLRESNSPGYHYLDHPDTRGMVPPEWSHLNRRDSDIYTRTIVKLLKQDKLLE